MIGGLVTGRVPPPLTPALPGVHRGRAEPSALLTPKGRMLSALRILREGPGADAPLLLEVSPPGRADTLAHLAKYVPPRLATTADVSGETAMITVLGPGGAEALGSALESVAVGDVGQLAEGDLLQVELDQGTLTLIRTAEVATPALDVLGPAAAVRALLSSLQDGGAPLADSAVWEALRVESGRPAFGADMDDTTIPIEAGIQGRVVDYAKGCFTGQEVLIRIRDRGHVNRQLRGLRMGEGAPTPGTELFREGEERSVGKVTSAVRSPRFGEAIGLGYVRREVEPPATLRLGGPAGDPVSVHDLETDWGP